MPATIAAVSTPPGEGGIGVVRISGPSAFGVADGVFRSFSGKRVADIPGYTALYGRVYDGDEELDEAVALKFASPKSYTGEDVAEISCHGGAYVTGRVLRAVLRAGAEPAGPGEFTRRAYLNGKMDLTRAEAVADIIAADGDAALREALRAREGAVFREAERVRGMLLAPASRIAAYCDEPDEPEEFAGIGSVESELSEAVDALDALLRGYESGKIRRRGASAVIAGKPNVGKSTLMNLLSGEERSIVTERAGTTRDVIEEAVNLGGVKLVLSDTAGLRDTPDPVERVGVRRAKEKLDGADIVLAVFDASRPLDAEDRAVYGLCRPKRHVLILNKADLLGGGGAADGVPGGVPGAGAGSENPLGGAVGFGGSPDADGFPTGVGDFGGLPGGVAVSYDPLGGAGGSPVSGNGTDLGGFPGGSVGFGGSPDGTGGSVTGTVGGAAGASGVPGGTLGGADGSPTGVGDFGGVPGGAAVSYGPVGGAAVSEVNRDGTPGGAANSPAGADIPVGTGGVPGGTAAASGLPGGGADPDSYPVDSVGADGSLAGSGGTDILTGGAAVTDNVPDGLVAPQRTSGDGVGGAPDAGGFPGGSVVADKATGGSPDFQRPLGVGFGGSPDGTGGSVTGTVGGAAGSAGPAAATTSPANPSPVVGSAVTSVPANPSPALFGERAVAISAKEGRGLDELSRAVREALGSAGGDGDAATLCGERQYSCVARARDAACSALSALRDGVTLDAVGVLIGDALEPLLELTGERVSDEVTDEVFRRFCVGK